MDLAKRIRLLIDECAVDNVSPSQVLGMIGEVCDVYLSPSTGNKRPRHDDEDVFVMETSADSWCTTESSKEKSRLDQTKLDARPVCRPSSDAKYDLIRQKVKKQSDSSILAEYEHLVSLVKQTKERFERKEIKYTVSTMNIARFEKKIKILYDEWFSRKECHLGT